MKALSVWQPWASLLALGLKEYETRSWYTEYRGQILIHAAKKNSKEQRDCALRFRASYFSGFESWIVPLGGYVACADLVDCIHCTEQWRFDNVSLQEESMGDFSPGRFAWQIANVRMVPASNVLVQHGIVHARGQQGLYNPSPEDVAAVMERLNAK